MLLTLALIAAVLADKWPKVRSSLYSVIHPSGLLATLFVFVLVILFAYAFPELRGRYPVAYFGIDILIALAMCYFSTDAYLTTKKPIAFAELAAAAMILGHGFENYKNRKP